MLTLSLSVQGFYNPGNGTFNAPANAGQSYSFTNDGKWEQALYLYESNRE